MFFFFSCLLVCACIGVAHSMSIVAVVLDAPTHLAAFLLLFWWPYVYLCFAFLVCFGRVFGHRQVVQGPVVKQYALALQCGEGHDSGNIFLRWTAANNNKSVLVLLVTTSSHIQSELCVITSLYVYRVLPGVGE